MPEIALPGILRHPCSLLAVDACTRTVVDPIPAWDRSSLPRWYG
ncbi:hypothetical protein JOF55_002405 [Haloactinomyces albus]|uniref:Uncharacterized protein n=1 Tax=Haloactinomyces albus TaxID=1352928 RepID=A0AAE3ZES4_9ACTN|nr:hypothetical protein [Haloactinomyces albus]